VRALERANARRTTAGLPCLEWSPEIASAATKHCAYYSANAGTACVRKPHNEDATCRNFVAERFVERLRLASYTGQAAYEVMAYVADGQRAVDLWVDSIWHRIPFFHPRVRHLGYGSVGACDTMDFGYGEKPAPMRTVLYPFDGQTNVPTKFEGRENPPPPAPPKGWPSGYPITLYAADVNITSHVIKVDETGEELPHTFLAPSDPRSLGLLFDEFMLYTDEPLKKKTRYRVVLDGAGTKDGAPVHHEWTFTTR
jgi:hypothetical protein